MSRRCSRGLADRGVEVERGIEVAQVREEPEGARVVLRSRPQVITVRPTM